MHHLVGGNWWDIFCPEESRSHVIRLYELFKQGDVTDYEMPLRTKQEATLIISWNSYNRRNECDGSLLEINAVGIDITGRKKVEEALLQSEYRFRQLFQEAPVGYHELDTQGRIIRVNRTLLNMLDYTEEEMLGRYIWEFYVEREASERTFKAKISGALPLGRAYERTLRRKDGVLIPVLGENRFLTDEKGNILGLRTATLDITRRKQAEEALQHALNRSRELETIINRSPAVVFLWRASEGWPVEFVSENIQQFGYTPEDFTSGRIPFAKIVHSEDLERVAEEVTRYSREGKSEFIQEYRILTLSGDVRWIEDRTWVRRSTEGLITHYQGIVMDITDRKKAEEIIRQLAYYDPLTDLPNRTLFNDRLSMALAHASRSRKEVAVMMLDLDYFKEINDTLGHSAGDQLLRVVAARLKGILRKEDTVARMGGDEFTLLLPNLSNAEDVDIVAEKIVNAFQQPFSIEINELAITASIGIALYPFDGEIVETLLKNADIAMYRAKKQGRNRYQRFSNNARHDSVYIKKNGNNS